MNTKYFNFIKNGVKVEYKFYNMSINLTFLVNKKFLMLCGEHDKF